MKSLQPASNGSARPSDVKNRVGVRDNAYGLLALASLFWSGNHVVGRAVAGHVPPLGLSTARWLLPTIVLLFFIRDQLRRDWPMIRSHWHVMLLLGVTGGAIFNILQYVGLHYTTALNVSVLNSLAPVFMVVAAAILFKDFMVPRQITGVVVSLAGVLVIISRGDWESLADLRFNGGDILVIVNMLVWAVFSACIRLKPPIHWLSFLFVLGVISIVCTFPFAVWEALSGFLLQPTAATLSSILYVAIFPSVLAIGAWNRGIELIGSNRAGLFLHLIPVYSAVLAGVFLGEVLGLFHVVGFLLILAGVWLAARKA